MWSTNLLLLVLSSLAVAYGQSTLVWTNMTINVMTLNVWRRESAIDMFAGIIQAGDADIVGLQEMNNAEGEALADQLGFHYHQQSVGDSQILSRFPIVSGSGLGAQLEIAPNHTVWLFNSHLKPYPYQPYDLRDGKLTSEAAVISAANRARGGQVSWFLHEINATVGAGDVVFFTGDFNEPSHLDWTQSVADATPRTYDLEVAYPASNRITEFGFADSFRQVRPTTDFGYTWTPKGNSGPGEVHDRIDFVYYMGPNVTVTNSQTIGPTRTPANPNTDISVPGFPSDHRVVVSTFQIAVLQEDEEEEQEQEGSILTFSGLTHNPGNDGALLDYGDRLMNTPNVSVAFFATGTSHWNTYDGDQDNNGNNHWNGGVAQLQKGEGTAEYEVAFVPDTGFGVTLDSFDLVDYVARGAGHSVHWELETDGSILKSGTEIIAADGVNSVVTPVDQATPGTLTLRVRHISGDGTDLAIDNISFHQVSLTGSF